MPAETSAGYTAPDLRRYGSCTLDDPGCQTCGEGAVPVLVVRVDGLSATVQDSAGTRAEVALEFVAGVSVGDVLLVQAGLALARLEPSHMQPAQLEGGA